MVGEVTSEGYVLCVFMDTDSSQSREIAGQPSHLWLVQQWRVGVCPSVFAVHSSGLTSLAVLHWLAEFGAQVTRSAGGSFVSSSSLELFSTKQFPEQRSSGMDKLTQSNSELLITSRGTAEESCFAEKQQWKYCECRQSNRQNFSYYQVGHEPKLKTMSTFSFQDQLPQLIIVLICEV